MMMASLRAAGATPQGGVAGDPGLRPGKGARAQTGAPDSDGSIA
jgi:hypothetical protein